MLNRSIAPVSTYSGWADLLDMLKNKTDDPAVLDAMKKSTLDWQTGVAERFTKKLTDAVNFRLNSATDRFQKEMSRAYGQERVIVGSLVTLRKELSFLYEAIQLPCIPEKDRNAYAALVLEQADNIQNSLEDSAKKDRTGKLTSIVRNNKVNSFPKG